MPFAFLVIMRHQVIALFLVGLAASACALDLSHAAKTSAAIEPRLQNIVHDLYANIIGPQVQAALSSSSSQTCFR